MHTHLTGKQIPYQPILRIPRPLDVHDPPQPTIILQVPVYNLFCL